jgi:hypothetical protein
LQKNTGQKLRRRLTAPGPTPLRTQTRADDEQDVNDITQDIVSPEDGRLALIPSISASPTPSIHELSIPVNVVQNEIWWRWVALGTLLAKVTLLVLPCSPYISSARIFWPLLGIAGLDVLLYNSFATRLNLDPHPRKELSHFFWRILFSFPWPLNSTFSVPTISHTTYSRHSQPLCNHSQDIFVIFYI